MVAIDGDPNLTLISDHGGLILWLELLRRTHVLHDLPVRVAGAQGWTDGQMMRTLLLLNIVGDTRVSDVAALEADLSLCRLVRDYEEAILGVSAPELARRFRGGRDRTFPSARSVLDWLARFQDADAGQAREPGRAMSAAEVVRFAHERCGRGEEVHAVLKDDLAGGMMPSGQFGINAAWWHLAVLSLNLNAVLRRCALGRDGLWTRMKQVRRHWVYLVARVVRHARVQRLRFQPSRVHRLHRALGRMSRSLTYDTS